MRVLTTSHLRRSMTLLMASWLLALGTVSTALAEPVRAVNPPPPTTREALREPTPKGPSTSSAPSGAGVASAGKIAARVVDENVVDGGYGTMVVSYVVEVASRSRTDVDYTLSKTLAFAPGVEVVSTDVTAERAGVVDDALANPHWDGVADAALTMGPARLSARSTAKFTVSVVARLTAEVSDRAADCHLSRGEYGTGLLTRIEITSGSKAGTSTRCLDVPRPALEVVKEVSAGPTRGDDGAVTVSYDLTVSNNGDLSTVYDLEDEFRFAVDAYVVQVKAVNLVPGGIETNPLFDGQHVLGVASAPLRVGASHTFRVTATVIDSQTARVAASRGGSTADLGSPDLGDASSYAASLFSELGKGAAGQAGGAAAGWAMGAMGISTGDSAALAQINSDLVAILDELTAIAGELADIGQAIQHLDCDANSTAVEMIVGNVNGYAQTYQSYIGDGAGTPTTPPSVPISMMTTLADEVVDPQTGLWNELEVLATAMLPSGGQGIIKSCLAPGVIEPPAVGAWGDNAYYANVQQVTDYYYIVQVNGLLVLQESLHFLAQQRYQALGGPALDPDDTQQVCAYSDPEGMIAGYCGLAVTYTNVTFENLASQLELAGASYDSGSKLSIQYDNGTARLVTKSLEALTTAAGDSCSSPLTSADPCGVTVGNQATAGTSNRMGVTYGGYDIWRPADWDEFNFLIGFGITEAPYLSLANRGISDPNEKVILSSTDFSWQDQDGAGARRTATKFVDTQLSPGVFSSDDSNAALYTETKQCPNNNPHTLYTPDNAIMKSQRNGWYDLDIRQCGELATEYNVDPGWFTAYPNRASAQQYRWPMITVTSLPCSDGRSHTNPGGAYTRCGADFDTWFTGQVPRPPTCAPSSTWGQCGAPAGGVSDVLKGTPLPPTSTAYDCSIQRGEDGTALWAVATASDAQGQAHDDACAQTPVPSNPQDDVPATPPAAHSDPLLGLVGRVALMHR